MQRSRSQYYCIHMYVSEQRVPLVSTIRHFVFRAICLLSCLLACSILPIRITHPDASMPVLGPIGWPFVGNFLSVSKYGLHLYIEDCKKRYGSTFKVATYMNENVISQISCSHSSLTGFFRCTCKVWSSQNDGLSMHFNACVNFAKFDCPQGCNMLE